MSRLVRVTGTAPVQVEDKWVCACGLTAKAPFCDGTHTKIPDGENGQDLYERKDGKLTRNGDAA